MTKTVDELSTAILRHLTVLDATETASAEDLALVGDSYRSKWSELAEHGQEVAYWPRDAIPEPVFLILRDLVALDVQAAFGQPINAADKEASETIIMRRLRRHVGVQGSGLPTKAIYY